MAKRVLNDILESFYERLAEAGAVDDAHVREIRELFASGKKLKADDFVAILSRASEERSS